MANSRLYIYDEDTNTAVMIAKTMGSGWRNRSDQVSEKLNEFFDGLEENQGYGMPDSTGLKIATEYEVPNDARCIYDS